MQKLMKAIHKNEKGFTLVELMVVVVIIGILVAIAIPIYGLVTENTERSACHANQRTIDGAIAMDLAGGGTGAGWAAFLQEVPVCPGEGGGTYLLNADGWVAGCPNATAAHGRYQGTP